MTPPSESTEGGDASMTNWSTSFMSTTEKHRLPIYLDGQLEDDSDTNLRSDRRRLSPAGSSSIGRGFDTIAVRLFPSMRLRVASHEN